MPRFPPHALASEPAITTAVTEAKKLWPFVAGLAFSGAIFFKIATSVTDKDVKNSKFTNPHKGH